MNTFRYTLLALALATLSLSNCKKDSAATPQPTTVAASQQLTSGSWRLDQIKEGGQVTSSGTNIKDQYSLTFRADGTYTQKTLSSGTTYSGTWMLMTNNTVLHLIDSKGSGNEYTVANLSATELRYSFTNKSGVIEERTFSAQP